MIFGFNVSSSVGANPVEQAKRAEALGFDFVSTADHPQGPDPSYETMTLLTWMAANTSRISVASRVLCAPLRRPALMAKAAESLDRLSDGRFILGLGSGHVDDEILAYTGRKYSAREKVDGLDDTLTIIRGAWSEPDVTHEGRIHRVAGLTVAPGPAHRIPIWLGTYGPRALALTGRLADGWIPSLGAAEPGDLPAMRGRIDEAAERAGRDPKDVRSILNMQIRIEDSDPRDDMMTGSVRDVVAQLRHYAELGFTGFSFAVLGPAADRQLRMLTEDVLPGVRAE